MKRKILMIILVMLFVGVINVKAEEITCTVPYTFKGQEVNIILKYDSSKTPKFNVELENGKDYANWTSSRPWTLSIAEYNGADKIEEDDFFDNGKLVCPNIKVLPHCNENKGEQYYEACNLSVMSQNKKSKEEGEYTDLYSSDSIVTKYYLVKRKSVVIDLVKSDNGYDLYKNSKKVSSNVNSMKSTLDDGKYPKYIYKSGDNYILTDDKPEGAEEIYLSKLAMFPTRIGGLDGKTEYSTCKDLLGGDGDDNLLNYIENYVMKIIWIGVPLLLILLTSWDFSKVVFTDDKDGLQNAFKRLKKRAIVSVLIFLTPTILIVIVKLLYPGDNTINDCVQLIRDVGKTSIIINTNLLK